MLGRMPLWSEDLIVGGESRMTVSFERRDGPVTRRRTLYASIRP